MHTENNAINNSNTTMSRRQTLEQLRARDAWNRIEEVRNAPGKYRSQVRKLPSLILTNGLGQAVAFMKAKKQDMLYKHLSCWVTSQMGEPNTVGDVHLMTDILESDSDTYRRMTTESLAYIVWLKRFAEAELPESGEGEDR